VTEPPNGRRSRTGLGRQRLLEHWA
jgi:hypothetical protein